MRCVVLEPRVFWVAASLFVSALVGCSGYRDEQPGEELEWQSTEPVDLTTAIPPLEWQGLSILAVLRSSLDVIILEGDSTNLAVTSDTGPHWVHQLRGHRALPADSLLNLGGPIPDSLVHWSLLGGRGLAPIADFDGDQQSDVLRVSAVSGPTESSAFADQHGLAIECLSGRTGSKLFRMDQPLRKSSLAFVSLAEAAVSMRTRIIGVGYPGLDSLGEGAERIHGRVEFITLHERDGFSVASAGSVLGRGVGFGRSAASIPDQDGDGVREMVFGGGGLWSESDAGEVLVVSPATGLVLSDLTRPRSVAGFGNSLSTGPDIGHHQRGTLLVGAPGCQEMQIGSRNQSHILGWVGLYEPLSAQLLFDHRSSVVGDGLGVTVALGPDQNADGVRDILAAASPFSNQMGSGYVVCLSGLDGSVLGTWTNESDTWRVLGGGLKSLSDLTGDGVLEYALHIGCVTFLDGSDESIVLVVDGKSFLNAL